MPLLPVSAIIPTLDRRTRLHQTLSSLLAQDSVPAEIIVIDASAVAETSAGLRTLAAGLNPAPEIIVLVADCPGAATQRNQGQTKASQPFLLFLDDDVNLEGGCVAALWRALQEDGQLAGCSAITTNQLYHPPRPTMRLIYRWLGCPTNGSLAGQCCGPALNFLPSTLQDDESPRLRRTEWLNLVCTLYRREALPNPALLPFFTGYSLMEDVAVALYVSRRWGLAVSPLAKIYHDTRPANYKDRIFAREKMEVINRWFVMRHLLGRNSLVWDFRQFAYQSVMLLLSLRQTNGWRRFPASLAGKLAGLTTVLLQGARWRGYPDSKQ